MDRYLQFMLMVLAAGAVYPMLYLRTNYQETMLEVFNMTLPQLNTVMSALGIAFTIGYLPSGIIADKFSAKKLVLVSLFGIAVGGFWFAQIPSYTSVIIIYAIWGFSAVLTFWSAHMKVVKMLASKGEEGRFFGILDGGRGVVEAILASVAVFIFARILGSATAIADKRSAMVAVIYLYSIVALVIGILVAVFVKENTSADNEVKEAAENEKFRFSDLGTLFKNKSIFIMAGIIFMSYAVTYTVYYFSGFLQTNVGVGPVAVSTIATVLLWMRPIGGIIGGFIADKFGKAKTVLLTLLCASALLVVISVIPYTSGQTVFCALIFILGFFIYAVRGTYWSLLGDCGVETKITGTAIGFSSLIGYLPEIFVPMISSFMFTAYGDKGGYSGFFISIAIAGAVGAVLLVLFMKVTGKKK
ncbi:MFS transporter [[Clostridium] hylemonae]|nr:MFS transporter [[Clostridium] hylemonae]